MKLHVVASSVSCCAWGSSCYSGITVAGVFHISDTFHLNRQRESTSCPFVRPISSEHSSVLFSTLLASGECLGFSSIVGNFSSLRYSGGQNDYNPWEIRFRDAVVWNECVQNEMIWQWPICQYWQYIPKFKEPVIVTTTVYIYCNLLSSQECQLSSQLGILTFCWRVVMHWRGRLWANDAANLTRGCTVGSSFRGAEKRCQRHVTAPASSP